jgi:ABC-type multidrug transport system ATPase subunit
MAPSADTPVLEVTGLHFGWPGVALFHNLNLRIPAGVSAVCGEESCGKSTLMRLLAGDLRAESGALDLCKLPLSTAPDAYRAQVFRTEPRSDALDAVSAREWLSTLSTRFPNFDMSRALDLAQGFGLEPHIDKPMYMLSAGSKRKVWLCAAFAAGTALTLIDEPFAALDMASIRFLHTLLLEAGAHPDRAWVLADHAPPDNLPLKTCLVLRA